MDSTTISLFIVGMLWGGTNPLIKRYSKNKNHEDTALETVFQRVYNLFSNIKLLLSLAANQCGSLIYFLTIQKSDLSFAVPIANSLTFVFTAVAGLYFGENLPTISTYCGIACIILGTGCCCLEKY